jgi:hypothetical protein
MHFDFIKKILFPFTLQAELDDLVASECIYCGFYMINSIDKPFLEEDDDSQGWL